MKHVPLYILLTVLLGVIFVCCDSRMISPTSSTDSIEEPVAVRQPNTAVPAIEKTPERGETGCNFIDVQRSKIKTETSYEKGVRFYVPATAHLGTGYYNIWIPAINAGKKLGPYSYNEWSSWTMFLPGKYEYQLAAETKTDSGKVYQCDRHRGEFEIKKPPKKCVWEPKPRCEWGNPIADTKICTWSCPPCKPIGEPECKEQEWDPELCRWVGECPQCKLPPWRHKHFQSERPWGNPVKECSRFGMVPVYDPAGSADLWITKCGLFYEVTKYFWDQDTCHNGKEVSHVTLCKCE